METKYLTSDAIKYVIGWAKDNNDLIMVLYKKYQEQPSHYYDYFCQIGAILFQECYYCEDKQLIKYTIDWLLEAKYIYENILENNDGLLGVYYRNFNGQFAYYTVLYCLFLAFMPTSMIDGGDDSDFSHMKHYIPFNQELALECLLKSKNMSCATFSCSYNLAYYYFATHHYNKALEILESSIVNISEYDKRMYESSIKELKENIKEYL